MDSLIRRWYKLGFFIHRVYASITNASRGRRLMSTQRYITIHTWTSHYLKSGYQTLASLVMFDSFFLVVFTFWSFFKIPRVPKQVHGKHANGSDMLITLLLHQQCPYAWLLGARRGPSYGRWRGKGLFWYFPGKLRRRFLTLFVSPRICKCPLYVHNSSVSRFVISRLAALLITCTMS